MRNYILVPALAMLLGACATGPLYQRPEVELPAQWQSGANDPQAASAMAWWTQFDSSELPRLVATAIQQNRNLKAAAARIAQARATARVAGASLLPEVEVRGDAARSKGIGDANASNELGLGLEATFELDLWGKNRQAHEAALGRILSSAHAAQFVRVQLIADVAQTYFQLLSANDRLALARRTLENAESLLRLFQIQHRAGAISALEVERQMGLVAGLRADIPALEVARQGALNALAILLGRPPQNFSVPVQSLASLRLPVVAAGLPSNLLEQRSDIRQAEADLIAAQADINAARAALFPSLRLTAAGGIASETLGALLGSPQSVYNLAAGLIAPIFNRGRLQGGHDLTKARQQELVQIYHQTILTALREVEDALTAVQQLAEQDRHQQQLIGHAQKALRAIEVRHRNGAIDFTAVLDAQRVLFAAQAAQEQIVLSRYVTAVSLFRALGGGWDRTEQVANAAPTARPAR